MTTADQTRDLDERAPRRLLRFIERSPHTLRRPSTIMRTTPIDENFVLWPSASNGTFAHGFKKEAFEIGDVRSPPLHTPFISHHSHRPSPVPPHPSPAHTGCSRPFSPS